MRGKQGTDIPLIETLRITPADAGKTYASPINDSITWDHPRGCGENFAGVVTRTLPAGITPADAGKTAAAVKKLALCQDHPRGCGENVAPMSSISAAPGSPPRMRGKHQAEAITTQQQRITPADAGKTCRLCF